MLGALLSNYLEGALYNFIYIYNKYILYVYIYIFILVLNIEGIWLL